MKIMKCLITVLVTGFVIVLGGSAVAQEAPEIECKRIKGMISSEVVALFPPDCPVIPILGFGICTVGKYKGGLRGDFSFVATDVVGEPFFPPNNPLKLVQFATGDIELTTKGGDTMTLKATYSVFFAVNLDFDPVLFPIPFIAETYGGLETITGGTGKFTGYSGHIRSHGLFDGGCINCKYNGEICRPVTDERRRGRGWYRQ